MNTKQSLLPCPFCSADELGIIHPEDGDWNIRCYTCHMETAYQATEAEAIAAWNNRPQLERQLAAPLSAELLISRDLLERLIDDAQDNATHFHQAMAGFRQAEHDYLDKTLEEARALLAQRAAPQAQNHLVAAPVSLPSEQHGLSEAHRDVRQMLYKGYSIDINHYGKPLLCKDGLYFATIDEVVEGLKARKEMNLTPKSKCNELYCLTNAGIKSAAVSNEQRDALERQSIRMFTEAVNKGCTFQEALASVFLSGIQYVKRNAAPTDSASPSAETQGETDAATKAVEFQDSAAQPNALIPEGHAIVPIEPNDAMLRPFYECPPDELPLAYAAMLVIAKKYAAAPMLTNPKE